MILYTVKGDGYIDYEKFLAESPDGRHNVYVNFTNRCNCACNFCLRATKRFGEEDSLWLKAEPTAGEIIAAFAQYDLAKIREIVFCGFGEPTMCLDTLLAVAAYLKHRDASVDIRLNTNGLADLEHNKPVAPLLAGLIDTVSVSLNASTAAQYDEITQNKFTMAHEAMLRFAKACQAHVPNVVLTVVDCIGADEIAACRRICEQIGIPLRVRKFE